MKKSLNISSLAILCAGLGAVGAAQAETSPWMLRLGPAHVRFDTKADVSVNGAAVPGADASASANTTLGFELSYDLTSRWTTRLLAGVPPSTTLTGTGALAGTGSLGTVKYGPAVLSLTYKLLDDGPVRPYLGGGVNYTIVFESRDAFISGLDVRSAFGSVLQAGAEMPLGKDWVLSLDARKIFLKTKATGMLPAFGGAAADASVRLDPLVVFLGIGTRF
jgi:outer membrane protein